MGYRKDNPYITYESRKEFQNIRISESLLFLGASAFNGKKNNNLMDRIFICVSLFKGNKNTYFFFFITLVGISRSGCRVSGAVGKTLCITRSFRKRKCSEMGRLKAVIVETCPERANQNDVIFPLRQRNNNG